MKGSDFSPSTLTSYLVSSVICLLKIDKKMVCIDIEFMCFLQNFSKCEHLIDHRISWTKTTLVGSNDTAQILFQSFTKEW